MSSLYPIFYTHTCTHTCACAHRVGGVRKVGEGKRTILRIKEKMIKTRGEKVGKQACRIQKYRGRKHQRSKSHTKSSRIRLASNIQHQKTVQQCLQSPPQKKEGPETIISHANTGHRIIFKYSKIWETFHTYIFYKVICQTICQSQMIQKET